MAYNEAEEIAREIKTLDAAIQTASGEARAMLQAERQWWAARRQQVVK